MLDTRSAPTVSVNTAVRLRSPFCKTELEMVDVKGSAQPGVEKLLAAAGVETAEDSKKARAKIVKALSREVFLSTMWGGYPTQI